MKVLALVKHLEKCLEQSQLMIAILTILIKGVKWGRGEVGNKVMLINLMMVLVRGG